MVSAVFGDAQVTGACYYRGSPQEPLLSVRLGTEGEGTRKPCWDTDLGHMGQSEGGRGPSLSRRSLSRRSLCDAVRRT